MHGWPNQGESIPATWPSISAPGGPHEGRRAKREQTRVFRGERRRARSKLDALFAGKRFGRYSPVANSEENQMDSAVPLNFLASLTAALVVGTFSFLGVRQSRVAQEHSEIRTRDEEADRLLRRYRDPLVWAAFDLQSRLYNIVTHDFLGKCLVQGNEQEKEYALANTVYVVGEYFGWVELLRRDIQFMDLRDVRRNRELATLLDAISTEFLNERPDTTFRLFRREQRAIGEAMMTAPLSGARESLGFGAFVARQEDPAFSRWFGKLRTDVQLLANEPGLHLERIVAIQQVLINLLEFLDPTVQYFPETRRRRVRTAEIVATADFSTCRASRDRRDRGRRAAGR
jgi:hypothetical protein